MKSQSWTFVDKTGWGDGPWQAEPDKLQWPDETTGLACLIVRNPRGGHLCGYVGVPKGHPAYQHHYDDVTIPGQEYGPEVHGGLTFASGCETDEAERAHGICHIVEPGEPDNVWWLGFDCAHAGDRSPGFDRLLTRYERESTFHSFEQYRDVAYVKAECASLARQLASAA